MCCLYLLLTACYYHIDKYTGGVIFALLTLMVPITFVSIIVYFVIAIVVIFRNRKNLTIQICLPFIVCLLTLMYTTLSPYRLDSEKLESKVLLRACYEGTQNQATLKFRENKTFELHWTGVFFYSEWFCGKYEQKADTLLLHYLTKRPYRFGDTIMIKDNSLITLNQYKIDSSQYFVPFYLGYCKGTN